MMHPLFLLYAIDILLEKTAKVFEKASIFGRTTAVVRSHISCCAHAYHVLCSRSSAVVRSSDSHKLICRMTCSCSRGQKGMEQRNLRNLREFFLVFLLFAHFFPYLCNRKIY